MKAHQRIASLYQALVAVQAAGDHRLLGSYYRVGFYGVCLICAQRSTQCLSRV